MIIAFGVIKDGFFIYSEQRHVNEMNKKFAKVYEYGHLCYQSKTWVDVKIGDIVYIQKDEGFPADVVLLYSPQSTAFIESSKLDGEFGLKQKNSFVTGLDPTSLQFF